MVFQNKQMLVTTLIICFVVLFPSFILHLYCICRSKSHVNVPSTIKNELKLYCSSPIQYSIYCPSEWKVKTKCHFLVGEQNSAPTGFTLILSPCFESKLK